MNESVRNVLDRVPALGDVESALAVGQRLHRRQRLFSAASVAVVAALIIGVGALWLPGISDSAPRPAANETTLPPAPEGTRWVGFNGVMVAVPQQWTTDQGGCGVPTHDDRIVIGTAGPDDCSEPPAEPTATMTMWPYTSSIYPERLLGDAQSVNLEGVRAYRTQGCNLSDPARCSGALVVPDKNAVFDIRTSDTNVVAQVLGTARRIPQSYTAVPDVAGMVDDSDVSAVISEAGLEWTPRCSDGADCEMAPLEATGPTAGTVVPVGTLVSAVSPSRTTTTTVPGVDGMSLADARRALANEGLAVEVEGATSDGLQSVAAQVPEVGSQARVGDVVVLTMETVCPPAPVSPLLAHGEALENLPVSDPEVRVVTNEARTVAAWFETGPNGLPHLVVFDMAKGFEIAREDLGVSEGDEHATLRIENQAVYYREDEVWLRYRWGVDGYPTVHATCHAD